MIQFKWYRVLYGPVGAPDGFTGGYWYGWRLYAPAFESKADIVTRLKRGCPRRPFRVDEIDPRDFDYPKENEE